MENMVEPLGDQEYKDYLEYLQQTQPFRHEILGDQGLLHIAEVAGRRGRIRAILDYGKEKRMDLAA